jgi:hypothetical protein
MPLTHGQVDSVRRQFEQLSPYAADLAPVPGEPFLLDLESANYAPNGERRQLYAWIGATKNYELYTNERDDGIRLVKHSEHGLGHLHPPQGNTDFVLHGKTHLVRGLHAQPSQTPHWWDELAVSIITLNRLSEIKQAQSAADAYAKATGRTRDVLRPHARLAVGIHSPNTPAAQMAHG